MHRLAEALSGALRRVAHFFRSGWKFVLLTTLALSLVLVPLILFIPLLYERDVAITIKPNLTELQERLGQLEPTSDQQIGNGAATFLRQGKAFDGKALIDPVYEESAGRIGVHMEAKNKSLLQTMDSRLVELLETTYQRSYERDLTSATETVLQSLDGEAAYSEKVLADTEREIERVSGSDGPATQSDLEKFEETRTAANANIDALEEPRRYFAKALEDMPTIADEAVTARVVDETAVRPKKTRLSTVVAAFLLSFVVAVAGALRAGHPRGK